MFTFVYIYWIMVEKGNLMYELFEWVILKCFRLNICDDEWFDMWIMKEIIFYMYK